MKRILLFFITLPVLSYSQQLPDLSPFGELNFAWNPAMTGLYDYWEVSADYRQQWFGFENAPRTAIIAAQYPFEKEKMSIGGVFTHDNIQPLKFSTLAFNYAYKFQLGFNRNDQASIGATVNASQYFVDALEIVVNDPDDQLVPLGESSTLSFNAGAGFFYTTYAGTRRKSYTSENAFFFGGAVQQVFPAKLVIQESSTLANWQRKMHANFILGARLVNDNFFIEPTAWLNFGLPNLSNFNIQAKIEKPEAFWAAITYSTNQTVAVQLGVITISNFAKDSYWRIGALGSYNVGDFGQYRGVGMEFLVAYRLVQ
ncbi:MAG: PorP/SprF family type IX secretion system membrane protein [Saprospiraceae bacterium]|nr:PorP/SprF family type IX secretion system membrane protein [Saprospiraceae bacterium]